MTDRKLLLNGTWRDGTTLSQVRSPWDQRIVSNVHQAGAAQIEEALQVAFSGRARVGSRSTGERRDVLFSMVNALRQRKSELVECIIAEAGKPRLAAETEVIRAIETFTLAASELGYFGGRTLPVDLSNASKGYECETRRFPAGVIVGIVPFNFPLNLGAHKVAPAMAVGAPIIVKPPPQAPSAQLLLGEIALNAGADPAALQVVPCANDMAQKLATDERVRVVSFTGSAKVGWHLKSLVRGKTVLELGGNAAVIVCEDAELEEAAQRCVVGAFGYAGQVCIKVQRVWVDQRVYRSFLPMLVEKTKAIGIGDPSSSETVVGPVIDDSAAERIESWIEEATNEGAQVWTGGKRKGRLVEPTVLTSVQPHLRVMREEVFGPVLVVQPYERFDEAIRLVNDTDYGLQAGVFTRDLARVRQAFHQLEVGAVVINDYPTFRSDNYPYGGVKSSGLGREGVRYAMEDFSEERVLITRVIGRSDGGRE